MRQCMGTPQMGFIHLLISHTPHPHQILNLALGAAVFVFALIASACLVLALSA